MSRAHLLFWDGTQLLDAETLQDAIFLLIEQSL